MPSELVAVLVDDRAGRAVQALPAEERPVVVAGEEAGLLALGARRDGEPGSAASQPGLALRRLSERKADAVEQVGIDGARACTTDPSRVDARANEAATIPFDEAGVVAGPESVGTGARGEVGERVEAEAPLQRMHGFGVRPFA